MRPSSAAQASTARFDGVTLGIWSRPLGSTSARRDGAFIEDRCPGRMTLTIRAVKLLPPSRPAYGSRVGVRHGVATKVGGRLPAVPPPMLPAYGTLVGISMPTVETTTPSGPPGDRGHKYSTRASECSARVRLSPG